jgi:hypothetical protein
MFSELDATAESEKTTRTRITEDLLVNILSDLQVSNVLMAGGLALGETGEEPEVGFLDEALTRLDHTSRAIDRSISSPLTSDVEPGRFGFADEVQVAETAKSKDLQSAIKRFRIHSHETLSTLVNEAQGTVKGITEALSKIDTAKVLAALSNLGEKIQDLAGIGRLIRFGVEKFRRAIDALIRLLGSGPLSSIKDKVQQVWEKIKKGEHIVQVLEWAFSVEDTRAYIEEILNSKNLDQKTLDDGSNNLAKLTTAFRENMSIVKALTSSVALAGTILSFTPLLGPNLALLTASVYALILAAVVLIGIDYADSGLVLQRVRGVRVIAGSLRS